jgi:hypothetical protein
MEGSGHIVSQRSSSELLRLNGWVIVGHLVAAGPCAPPHDGQPG